LAQKNNIVTGLETISGFDIQRKEKHISLESRYLGNVHFRIS